LLSVLAGWLKPVEGLVEQPPALKVGWVFQNPFGVANRTVLDHLVLPLLAKGRQRHECLAEAHLMLEAFGLAELSDQPFSSLSGGEAQRLMLARGLAAAPDLFLVDEPTAQLDLRTADSVNKILRKLSGQGAIVIVATHDPRTRDACDQQIDLGDYQ
jgi:ABC-type lipoprotein export system ATPase subunit